MATDPQRGRAGFAERRSVGRLYSRAKRDSCLKKESVIFSRAFAMPSKHTFRIKPIADLLARYPADPMKTIDPFCGESTLAYYRNDVAEHKMLANDFLDWCIAIRLSADLVLFDPPYSSTQIKRAYAGAGREVFKTDTQGARLYKEARERLDKLLVPGGIAISCGWNTTGFGKGYDLVEVLIVNHGGAHYDTLVTVQRKANV